MQPLGIRELAEQAKRLGAIDLAQGIIQVAPPSVLEKALASLRVSESSLYDNRRGVLPYREALRSYLATRGWNVELEAVMATSGAIGATASALLAELRPGATVLLPEPFFIGHKLLLETLGFRIKYFPVPLEAPLDGSAFAAAMRGVDAALLTTPANPTGQVVSVDAMARLSVSARNYDCLLIIDEMYREFIWNDTSSDDSSYEALDFQKTVLLRSFSKTLAIPGWRVGFALTTPGRVENMARSHDALYLGGSTLAQHALAEALTNNHLELGQYVDELREMFQENMNMLAGAFIGYGMTPLPVPATYYLLLKHNRESDQAAVEELLQKKIAVTPLSILLSRSEMSTGYIRIHFALQKETVQKVAAILES